MDPRINHIINYLKEHSNNYSNKILEKELLNNGYNKEEIEEAKAIIKEGKPKESFFGETKKKIKDKNKFPYHIISLLLSVFPLIGSFYGYYASKKINKESLKGRETAFISILINITITILAILIMIKKN